MSSFARPIKSDLVISVTLAELFLLLTFVVWYGFTPVISSKDSASLKDRNAELEEQVSQLQTRMNQADTKIKDLTARLDFWHRWFPGVEENSPSASGEVQSILKEACRSSPSCQRGDNLIINANVINGSIVLTITSQSEALNLWFSKSGRSFPSKGTRISNHSAIYDFLQTVNGYYEQEQRSGKACRFDYSLRYGSKADYYDGRSLLEKYFYPAGVKEVSE